MFADLCCFLSEFLQAKQNTEFKSTMVLKELNIN